MRKQPLLVVLLCYVAGIFLCDFSLVSISSIYILVAIIVLLVVLFFSKAAILLRFRKYIIALLFILLGFLSHFFHSQKPQFPNIEGKQKIVFKVNKKLNSNQKYRKYEVLASLNSEEKPFAFNMVLYVPKEEKPLDFKHTFQSYFYINQVKSPDNDFQFDYAKYLARKNIYYQGFVTDEVLQTPKKSISFSDQIKQKRLDVLTRIDESLLPKREKEFLKGIILADRTEMDEEMVSDFSKSGLVHFLAISGTHLVIIFWLILFLLKPIFSVKQKNISIILALLLLWSFTVFIDYGSSVVRSCLMITSYYCFVLLQRKPDLLHAMAIAGFVILIFDTHQLFDVGFQLSFVAVFGVFWLNEPILSYFPKPKSKFQNFIYNIISVSLAAQLATLPLVIYYFHQYSLLSIIANIVIVPFSEIIIIFSLLMTVIFALGYEFSAINFLYEKIVDLLLKGIHFFAQQDLFFFKNIPLNALELVLFFLLIFLLKNTLLRKNKSFVRFLGIAIILFLVKISSDFYCFNKSELLIIHQFKEKIVIQKDKGKAVFWVSNQNDISNVKRFVIDAYITERRIKDYKIKVVFFPIDEIVVDEKMIR